MKTPSKKRKTKRKWNAKRKKKTMIQRGRRRQALMKRTVHYLNLVICMWSSRSEASLRSNLSHHVFCRTARRHYTKR